RGPGRWLERCGQRGGVDHQRVIARGLEWIRHPPEQPPAVVVNRRRLAVHDAAGSHDGRAEGGTDRLVAEADAQNRNGPREALDQRHRDARLVRRAWPGLDDHAVGTKGGDLLERDRVVATDVHVGAELAEVLHEVVGEGVVVIDHEELRAHSCSARRTAWIMARALFTHSRCSASGSESATMPAPAWM